LSGIKKLAGQTLWYGVPKIVSRFLNYGLTLLGFQLFDAVSTSDLTQVYALIPFLNIVFTYGLETSYFRFAQQKDKAVLYNTLNISIVFSTILFTILLFVFKSSITNFVELQDRPEFVTWMIWITFFDTLAVIPFAKMRLEERPRKYAFVNLASAFINILLVVFFLFIAKGAHDRHEASFLGIIYNPDINVGYFIIANLVASIATLLFLYKEISVIRFVFDKKMWQEVMLYSYPLIIVGFGGMINEMLSRLVYRKVLDDDALQAKKELGIFGANYKLAVLITIFIQIFKLAAEPFFFNQSKSEDAQRVYARVMKFFVIACSFMFLAISLFLDFWQLLIARKYPEYAEGIHIVPILALASVFLGIYYNLSVWYKLTNRNMTGAYITIAGAIITVVLNIAFIPQFRYTGSAWATFICYAFMMVISYILGQKYYTIPYAKKKLLTYLAICVCLYILHEYVIANNLDHKAAYFPYVYYGTSLLFIGLFTLLIIKVEKKEFERLPFIGKLLYRTPNPGLKTQ
jgi:O-antigen/teichoic acid export membrane protein